mgnify:CR=1 FL=1|jgi:hypothetical protein
MIFMVEMNHNAITVSADTTIKGAHGVVVAVHVTKAGASGDKLVLRNGTSNSDTIEFTVFGEGIQNVQDINRRFESGIRADITGSTAEYIVIYK